MSSSQNQFDLLFENLAIGIYRTSPDGRVLLANPALAKMLGYNSTEELYKINLEETGFEPSYPRSYFKKLLEERGVVQGLEYRWIRKDGTILFIRENARAVRDDDGNVLYYEGTIEDISDKKIKEEQLRRSEENFYNLFQFASEALIIQDKDRNIIDINQAAEKLFGYSKDELTSNPEIKLYDPEKTNRKLASVLMGKAFKGEPVRVEWWGRKKDGTSFPEELILNKTTYNGEEALFMSIRDITEKKKAEEALNLRLEFQEYISDISAQFINLPVHKIPAGIQNSIERILNFTEMECGYLFLFSEDEDKIEDLIGTCTFEIKDKVESIQGTPTSDLPWLIQQLKTNPVLLTLKTRKLPTEAKSEGKFLEDLEIKTATFIPLTMENKLLGFLAIGSRLESAEIEKIDPPVLSIIGQILANAVTRMRIEIEREQLIENLQTALKEVKQLSGLLPICSGCKKIRDDKGYWHQVEAYISSHSDVQFSHGLCPDCLEKYYPEEYKHLIEKKKINSANHH